MGDILDEALEEIPIHKTRPWVSAWIVNLSEISPNTSTFRARFEFNVFWYLSDEDEKSYKAAIREKVGTIFHSMYAKIKTNRTTTKGTRKNKLTKMEIILFMFMFI